MLENRYGVVVRVDMGAWRLYVPRALRLYSDRSFPPIWICYACAGSVGCCVFDSFVCDTLTQLPLGSVLTRASYTQCSNLPRFTSPCRTTSSSSQARRTAPSKSTCLSSSTATLRIYAAMIKNWRPTMYAWRTRRLSAVGFRAKRERYARPPPPFLPVGCVVGWRLARPNAKLRL